MTEDTTNDHDTAVDETPTASRTRRRRRSAVAAVAAALVLAGVFQGGYWRGLLQTHHLTTSACWSPADDSDACVAEQQAGVNRRAEAARLSSILRTKAHLNAIAEQFEQEAERLKVEAVAGGWTQRQVQDEYDHITPGIDTDDEDEGRP